MRASPRNPHNLELGDLVEITWVDTQSLDRQTTDDLRKLPELEETKSYGVVLKLMQTSIVIAHEIGDIDSDGWHVEQLAYGMITGCRVFARINVKVSL